MLNNITEITCCLLMATSLFSLLSCNKENDISIDIPIEIYSQISPVSTPMKASSIIALPDGITEEHIVINSMEELHNNIPNQILNDNPEYKKIDFNNSSLIIIKFRLFYKLQKLDYKIYTEDFHTYKIRQMLSVENTLLKDGLFVMSGVVTKKIPTYSTLTIEQSFIYL